MRITFTLQRFNPEVDAHAHDEDYRLEIGRGATILESLIRIRNEQDGTLALRYSCRSAICGSCAMTINGHPKLACRTAVRQELERHGQIHVAPLRNLPIIKDLVADMSPFWNKIEAVTPWLTVASAESSESKVTHRPVTLTRGSHQFHNVDACIMCSACVAACTSYEVSSGFLGPAALAKADRFLSDPRESHEAKQVRLKELEKPDGMWDCTRCNFCVEVCPKDVKPMEAIIRLRRAAIENGLTDTGGARHILGFTDIVRREGRLNEAVMPLKVVGLHLTRLLRVIPLGIRMLLKGKVPNPLAAPIQGIGQVRAIFAARRRANPS
ncbi:MAG: succinate dehydrogenase/fumarate reductase iron-sulfur subunit [Nitrospiraceae bacterium]